MKPKGKFLFSLATLTGVAVVMALLQGGKEEVAAEVKVDARAVAQATYESEILPLLERFCYDCHGDGSSKGDLVLDEYTDFETMLRDRGTWEDIMHQIESKVMPPPKKEQPSDGEREKLLGWIERSVFHFDCEHPDPGRVTLRRLNREEYNNTVRDLVGVPFRPADDFPSDDTGYGFDNIGDVLSLSPVLFEKYLAAAEKILGQAIRTEDPPKSGRTYEAKDLQGGGNSGSARVLASEGEIVAGHEFHGTGLYRVRIVAAASQAGDEPAKMALRIDGNEQKQFEVPKGPDQFDEFTAELKIEKGGRRVDVRFLNDFYDPGAADQNRRDRNLFVRSIRIEGPLDAAIPPPPDFHRRYLGENVPEGERPAVARKALEPFVLRAFRRPATAAEIERLLAFVGMPEKDEPYAFEKGMKLAFTAVLASPNFLFRGEVQEQPDNPSGNYLIDEFALATRLSYFLWSSTPDDRLLELAGKGELRANLKAETERMLADGKARALTANFAGQWLQLRNVEMVSPDRKQFPEFNGGLAREMRRETEMVFERIVKEDRSVLEFLTADYTYLNERLARYYSIDGVRGGDFKLVSLQGTPRGGILTHGSILTLTSNPTRTSPVKRGKWVLENILGTPPPEPPANVPPLEERRRGDDRGETLRQRLEKHREDPNCAACHALMDPIGFAFENFDATGRWRDKDGHAEIDPTGELVSGQKFGNAADLRKILAEEKHGDFVRCMSDRMLTYALGRGLEFYDKCAVKEIVRRVEDGGYRFSTMVEAVVDSVPFQYRRGDGERAYE